MTSQISRALKILFYLFFLGLVGESALRLQQVLGPIEDLEFQYVDLRGLSDTLNHVHIPGKQTFVEKDIEELRGREVTYVYDELGLKVDPGNSEANGNPQFGIVYLGDSFMDGYEGAQTLPEWVRRFLQQGPLGRLRIAHWNAGCVSYSPSIFIPQAKQLIPQLKPDFVVVDIDNTDLGDDAFRYRDLVKKDAQGSVAAVSHSSLHADHLKAYDRIRRQPFYLARFFQKIYYQRFEMPRLVKAYARVKPRDTLSIVADPDPAARDKYADELQLFSERVDDLARTLVRLMGSPERIVFIYHPHLQQLTPAENGHLWHDFVPEVVGRTARQYGISFYDATEDLRKKWGKTADKFYFKGDMHFNYQGLRDYSEAAARFLEPRLHAYALKAGLIEDPL